MSKVRKKNRLPLENIRVVELAAWVFVPATGGHLADMGADVVKIESPVIGDPCRGVMGHIPASDFNYTFEVVNRDKRSIVLDLKNKQAREVAHRLIEKADVFISNYTPKSLKELEMDYNTLSAINPRLIYGLGSGWGPKGGPDPRERVFDYLAFSRSGLQFTMGDPGEPPQSLPGLSDNPSGLVLAYGVLLALRQRDLTGEGQFVDVSLLRTFLNLIGRMSFQAFLTVGDVSMPSSRKSPRSAFINLYRTKDDRRIQFCMAKTEAFWSDVCKLIDRPDLVNDERFNTPEKREKRATELATVLDEALSKRTLAEWSERFEGKNIAWAPVQNFRELTKDPRFIANDPTLTYDHPRCGKIKECGFPAAISGIPTKVRGPAPDLGQHTEEILLELGYDWDDIGKLRDERAIFFK